LASAVRKYAAAGVLVTLALFFNWLHWYTEVVLKVQQNTTGYFLNTTAENLQSECWQVALAAWAFKHFKWIGTPDADPAAPNTPTAFFVPVVVVAGFVVAMALL
jgi:hypothetical protein